MSFDVAPPTPVSPNPNVPNAGTTSVTLPPPGAAPATGTPASGLNFTPAPGTANDVDVSNADKVYAAAEKDEAQAAAQAGQLYNDFKAAQAAAATDLTGTQTERVRTTGQAYDTAIRALQTATAAKENAAVKMHDASVAAVSRQKDPDLRIYYQAHADQAEAAAALSRAQGAALSAKTPEDIKNLQAQTTEATARAQSLNLLTPAQAAQANQQANLYSAQAQQVNTLLPFLARQAGAQATVAEAQAGVAPQAAQAALAKSQADVDQARATIDETRRRIAGMPTEQQAQAAIDLGLKDKQADLDAKQAQLEQARKLMPLAVSQAGANVAATEAGTAATLAGIGQKTLGPLYGIGDQISRYRDMIATGQISPQDADTALNSYLNTQVTGATPFQAGQEQNRYQEAARQQNVGFAQTQLSNLTGAAGQAMGTFQSLAARAPEGYGQQFAQGYADTMNQLWDQYNRLTPAAAAPSAVSQAPVVHINIGGGQPTSSSAPAAPAPAASAPAAPQLPAAPPPLPAAVGAVAPAAADTGTPDWFGALQQRQAASAQEQQAQGDVWQSHLDNWKDELDSGAVTMPSEGGQ